ncbi:hypothetical protein DERP_000038 [Dermatophagoides pteronyssinus]|uniref:Uncharacterized protein n=1 Tax=Dermatophagoides pteronyssinus TaxID=6956 RepID=A0ABQ8IZ11_DERPT|nr:hypothetical protein DERP_000038 [Dermatophagoides pteronyssinus]
MFILLSGLKYIDGGENNLSKRKKNPYRNFDYNQIDYIHSKICCDKFRASSTTIIMMLEMEWNGSSSPSFPKF